MRRKISQRLRYVPRVMEALPRATAPRPVPPDAPLDAPELYFNKELSYLDFNWRVLFQALDERNPLLERVRFLAIAYYNLDDFFRKRVGGLKRQLGAGVTQLSPDGRTPGEQLELIRQAVVPMYGTLTELWQYPLREQLATQAGVRVLAFTQATPEQRKRARKIFVEEIYPVLTPIAVEPGRPFPYVPTLTHMLLVRLRHPEHHTLHHALLKVPSRFRWLEVDARCFIPLEEVIAHYARRFFRGMEVRGVYAFRITRNADIRRNEEEAEDLVAMIAEEIREREIAPVVRLEVDPRMPDSSCRLLRDAWELTEGDVYVSAGMLELNDCMQLADLDLSEHRFPPWNPVTPVPMQEIGKQEDIRTIFDRIRQGDWMVHHPYESFQASVQRFVEEAASDPQVVAIKQTLYRTSEDSPVVRALARASQEGKQVAVLVEVKARFEEALNIEWGRYLEEAGVDVTYGVRGLKTHAKVALVLREEEGHLQTYLHVGTGNYHPETARLYSDVGLFTADRTLGKEVINLFHFLTGYALDASYKHIWVAPRDMRRRFLEAIEREIAHHKAGRPARIRAKMNGLGDIPIIQALYRASRAGVPIDLVVRGHCRLRPGLPGYSETIRVFSIIGRFLEHSRIYYFENGGEPEVLIGSADWQRRNLEDRVEVVVPLREPALKRYMKQVLELACTDNRLAWDLDAEGYYHLRHPQQGEEERNFQEILMRWAQLSVRYQRPMWDFELKDVLSSQRV